LSALLLDTHAWLWLAAGDPRLARHERTLSRAAAGGELLLSAISVYETALIGLETEQGRRRGRQAVQMRPNVKAWIRDALEGTRVALVPIDAETALEAAASVSRHADLFDRLIVAAAVTAGARLVTADAKIVSFAKNAGLSLLEV
jgi:PIN domain nuclease of toxin-antitoxin system